MARRDGRRVMRVPAAWIEWLTLPRAIAVLVVVGGGMAWLFHRARLQHDPGAGLALLPYAVVAAVIAAPAVIALVTGYVRWCDERIQGPWQGTHHAFDDHRIRVVEARDRLWFASDDVHAALGLRPRPAVLRRLSVTQCRDDPDLGCVLSNDGLAAVFGAATDRQTLRLLRWADGDVRRPWQKRRDATRRVADPLPPANAPTAVAPPDESRVV